MRKLFSLFVALLATSALLGAADFQLGDLYYKITNDTLAPYTVEVTYETMRGTNYPNLTSTTIPKSVSNKGKNYSVTSIGEFAFYSCPSLESITIPNSVTSIGEYAFQSCKSLTSITIPNDVTSIGGCTFSGCSSLTSISIPNSVISIGERAFTNCYSLATVTLNSDAVVSKNYIPDSTICTIFGSQVKEYVIGNSVTAIGDYAFFHCDSLTSIAIGNSVKSIGNCAFWGCKLTSIDIPNSVTSIGDWTFAFCDSLTSIILGNNVTSIGHDAFTMCKSLISINIPNSVISIGEMAFSYCDSLSSIILGNNVTSIGHDAFKGCKSLTSINIPNMVTSIGDMTFLGCNSLTSVTIGNSVTNIGYGAFVGCKSLTSINISNSVTSIEKHAFYNCSSLASVTLGNSITNIEDSVFFMCNSLDTIYCYATIPPVVENTFINNDETNNYKATLYVPCESLEAYKAHAVWGQFANIKCIPEKEKTQSYIYYTSSDGNIVEPNAYLSATDVFGANIISNTYENGQGIITFDGPVTSIGQEAFYACTSLTSISIPNSVTTIGHLAFTGCSSLTSITIPKSVTDIGKSQVGETYRGPVFTYCPALTSIVVEEGNPIYDSRDNCNAIIQTATNTLIAGCQNTTIPNSVTSIGDYAFNGCSSLTSITIPNHITNIQSNPFLSCSSLATIVVESGNPIYDSRDNCNAIIQTTTNTLIAGCQNTTIPESVTSIGGLAFYGCSSLTVIAIPENVTSIGSSAFHGCSSLTSITIPEGVTSIEPFTFYGCSSLTSINIPENVTSIGVEAFGGCSSLTSINIPENVTSIGDGAFSGCSSLNAIYCYIVTPIQITPRTFGSSYNKAILYVPCEALDAYLADKVWEKFDNIQCIGDEIPKVGNSIYYTSSDGNIVNPYKTDGFDAKIISNTYENGRGTITFDGLVGSIRDSAFYSCHRLTSITIPKYVDEIGAYAFYECSLLYSITCLETTPPSALDSSRPKLYSFQNYDATVYVPCEALEAYKEHRVWSKFADIQCFEDSVPDTPKRVLSCAEAVTVCLETGATATTEEYTIHGYVTEITTEYSEQYKNISFYMADTKDGGQVLFTYRIKPMYEADIAVKLGDFVEVVGKLVNYNGYLPEVYPGVYTIVNEPELPTGTSDIQLPTSNTKKVVKDGQLLILRDGKTYTIMGAEVK